MSADSHLLGRTLVLAGLLLAGCGALLLMGLNLSWLGRLPGDIAIRREGFSFYLPLTSCLVVSLLVSLVMWLIARFRS